MCTATMVVEKENVYALGIVCGVELLLRRHVHQNSTPLRHTATSRQPHGQLTPFFSCWLHHSYGQTTEELLYLDSRH